MKRRNSCFPILLLFALLLAILVFGAALIVPALAERSFGPPTPALGAWGRFSDSITLVWNVADLNEPRDPAGAEQLFVIQEGENAVEISGRLEQEGLIRNADTFRVYLIWTGGDTFIQTGTYRLSPAMTARTIADMLRSSSLTEVTFSVLPGWRMEEIARSLPTSGLSIDPPAFVKAAASPLHPLDFWPAGASAEGFLAPGNYTLPRTTTADQLVSVLLQGFTSGLTPDLRAGLESHGLTVYQAVTLASIIQREAVVADEMPMIASVFYNRLAAGMDLQSDPTVQYALGYNIGQGTWWTNPLSLDDLQFNSPYNTYVNPGLPPGPISNPGPAALQAVANPAQSSYLFFQARCDGSGLHNFAETFEQHLQNNCP
ncbi:MAG TPA: endolytic transglycosylase MltG [Anaerolineales bacterium]|nr:endolytic transglycosylase MltG [Anaerolineales bacterium]